MEHVRSELSEGVSLTTVTTDRFKSALLTVHLLLPLRKETAAAASLLTDVLMRGTEQYPTMQALNRRQDELYSMGLGAFVQKKGETQSVTFELSAIDDRYAFDGMPVLREGMALLHQLIFHPVLEGGLLRGDFVEQEKKNLIDEIRSEINNKTNYAIKQCRRALCDGEPYAIDANGSESDVLALTRETLTGFYRRVLKEARVEILYVGKKTHDELRSMVSEFLPFAPRAAEILRPKLVSAREQVQTLTERMQVKQCQMVLGFRIAPGEEPKHFCTKAVFMDLFSSSPVSRLFMQVREKLHLCYSCFATADTLKGVMFVSCGLEKKHFEKAKAEILKQLNELKTGIISEEELEQSRLSVRSALAEVGDTPSSLLYWYFSRLFTGNLISPDLPPETVSAVTVDEIASYASRMELDTVFCLEGGAQ